VDWIIFGDDWGAHPSTTQHLALHLPPEDSVIWVDSIGMRKPKLRIVDIKRLWAKASVLLRPSRTGDGLYRGTLGAFHHIAPRVLPWHDMSLAVSYNSRHLRRSLNEVMRRLSMTDPVLLTSYPAVVPYLDAIPHRTLAYLRLDDYAHYPGVDIDLVQATEHQLFERADVILVTGQALLPSSNSHKAHYLPQGVHHDHFATVPLEPPRKKILGFFGTLASWLDFELVADVAKGAPDWQLEFVGKVEYRAPGLEELPNVTLLPPVPFADLPQVMSGWSAAWIPFQLNSLTEGVNPLKVREYLAAGLPTHCTPLPEVAPLSDNVLISDDAGAIVGWMEDMLQSDSGEARRVRRESVRPESWRQRSVRLREIITECQKDSARQ
jgi:glycosyltransferase involved in cell wall biosynthesis